MKEASFTLKDLANGLRPTDDVGRNMPYMLELLNVKCGENGLQVLDAILQPFTDEAWPFPQVMVLSKMTLLATASAVYSVDMTTYATTLLFSQASTSQWHVADFGDYVLMTNGSNVWHRDTEAGTWSEVL